jgi:hypothetical protein
MVRTSSLRDGTLPLAKDLKSFSLAKFVIVPLLIIGGSSNGRTAGFGPAYRGSNPCPPAKRNGLNGRSRIKIVYRIKTAA